MENEKADIWILSNNIQDKSLQN